MIAVILAGGAGRRMGGVDKGGIKIGERRMVDTIADRLMAQGANLKISGRHDYGLNLETIPDLSDGPSGPVGGIFAVSRNLEKTGVTGFFTVPVDAPNMPDDLLSRLHSFDCSAIAEDEKGLQPAFAWWRLGDLTKAWAELDFNRSISLKQLAATTQAKPVTWVDDRLFANINTADDLADYTSKA